MCSWRLYNTVPKSNTKSEIKQMAWSGLNRKRCLQRVRRHNVHINTLTRAIALEISIEITSRKSTGIMKGMHTFRSLGISLSDGNEQEYMEITHNTTDWNAVRISVQNNPLSA